MRSRISIDRKIDWISGQTVSDLGEDEAASPTPVERARGAATGGASKRRPPNRRDRGGGTRAKHHAAGPRNNRNNPQPRRRRRIRPIGLQSPLPRLRTARPARQGRQDDEAPVVGMGDHVPMFLLRPVRLKPAKAAVDEDGLTSVG